MKNHIAVRTATGSDAFKLAALSRKTFIDAFASFNNPDDFNAYVAQAFTDTQIASELNDPKSTFFIAELNLKWIGYAKLHQSVPLDCVEQRPVIELSRLYCMQEHLGCGVGKTLVDACIRYAAKHDFKAIWLGSWKENHRGNAFYRKNGFKIAGSKTFTLGSDVQEDHVFVRSVL